MAKKKPDRPGYERIFVASITLRNGRKIYARAYGLKAFAIWVPSSGRDA